jgi:hypothetical protein
MLAAGIPVGAGTDATRVASYNPWTCLYWLVSGKTIGGLQIYDETNRLEREEALRLWTEGSAWFSTEDGRKGRLVEGQFADVAVLSADYFRVPDDAIRDITSLLTVTGGCIVHAAGPFASLAPPLPPASPDWSPVGHFDNFDLSAYAAASVVGRGTHANGHCASHTHSDSLWGPSGCTCFAF